MNFSWRFATYWAPSILLAVGLWAGGLLPAHAQLPSTHQAIDQLVLPPITPSTQVSITAKVPNAYAAAGIPGSFLLTRTGTVLQDLTVNYQVSGKAVAGQDYKALKGTRVISEGKDKVQITINPFDVPGSGGSVKGVRVTLLPGDGYAVSGTSKATVKIVQ